MSKTSKIRSVLAVLLAAITVAAGVAISTARQAKAEETGQRTHVEYALQTKVGAAAENSLNTGVTRYMNNGYVNLTTSGGGVSGSHGFKIALENGDFTKFKTIWLNAKAISGNWGDVRALIKLYDESDNVLFWNAKKVEPTIAGNSNMATSYMYQSYGFGQNTYAEYLRDNNYIKVKTNVDTWYGLKFQTEQGTYENIIDAAEGFDLNKIAYATVNFDSYEKDVALDIGEFYGETFDGQYVRLFNPNEAALTDAFDANVTNTISYSKSGAFAEEASSSVSVNKSKYTIVNQNDWKWCSLGLSYPSDISAYNAISFDADTTAGTKTSFELYFSQGGATWSNGMTGALFTPESGDAYYADGRFIPAGFKGNITVPLTNFRNKFNTAGVSGLDITKAGNLGVILDCHEEYAGSFNLGNFKLVNDALSQYNEYRNVEDENGELQYVNILRTQYDGDSFAPEILVENGSVRGSSTDAQWNKYCELVAGISSQADYNKKYELTSSETHSDTIANQILNYGEVGIGYRRKTVYNRKKYTISLDENGGDDVSDITTVWGASVTLPVPVRAGYTFLGWFKSGEETQTTVSVMPTENISLAAKWSANSDTAYTVKSSFESADGAMIIDETKTQTLRGTTDTTTAVVAPEVEHYEARVVEQKNIAGDGSTVIVIEYVRKQYTVTFAGVDESGTVGETHSTVTAKWGKSATATDPSIGENFDFVGWYYGTVNDGIVVYGDAFNGVVPQKNDTVYAKYERKTANYTVKHLIEGLDGEYTEKTEDRETKTGGAGLQTEASAKTYNGFTAATVTQTAITADGSTTIEIRYARNEYTVTFKVNGEVYASRTVKYEGKVSAPDDPTVDGYAFDGWSIGGENVDFDAFTVKSNVTIDAVLTEVKAPEKKGCSKANVAELIAALSALAAAIGILIIKK